MLMFIKKIISITKDIHKGGLLKYVLIGIILRIIVLPITMMTDLTQSYFDGYIFFRDLGFGAIFNLKGMSYLIQQFFFLIYKLISPNSWFDFGISLMTRDYMGTTYAIQNSFISFPHLYFRIFLLKLPLILFEIGSFYFLNKMIDRKNKKLFYIIWFLNPINLFVIYIFGTQDVFGMFFIILMLYALSKEKMFLGLICLLLSSWSKFQGFLIIPLLMTYVFKKSKETSKKVITIILPIVFVFYLIFQESFLLNLRLTMMTWPYNYFFLKFGEQRETYVFFLVYFFILLHYMFKTDNTFKSFWKYSLMLFLSMFATIFFHTQWFLVIIPFIILGIIENKELLKPTIILFVLFVFSLLYWENHLTFNLFIPLAPEFIQSLPSVSSIISNYFPFKVLINMIFTGVSSVCIYIIYRLFKSEKQNISNN